MIKTDTKRLRRDAEGFFSVAPQAVVSATETLCDYCGTDACQIRTALTAALRGAAHAPVLRCGEFVPVIGFSVVQGLGRDRWNTIRIGHAWAARLKPGAQVAVMDLKRSALLRRMTVEAVYTGTVSEMCRDHGENNHAALENGWRGETARTQIARVLRNAYGSRFTTATDGKAAAIYLKA